MYVFRFAFSASQFWVAAVILLGFLEKVFFVSEYSTANQGQECQCVHLYVCVCVCTCVCVCVCANMVLLLFISLGPDLCC